MTGESRYNDIRSGLDSIIHSSYNPSNDTFGRLRVSENVTLFDSKFLADKLPIVWDEEIIGGATSVHSSTNAQIVMSTTSNNDAVIRQTKMRFNYQPGKSQLILLTGLLSIESNITKRIGYFSSSSTSPYSASRDGLYFESDGTTVNVCIAKNGTINSVSQSSWNLDKLDGTGESKVYIDFTKVQIFVIDFQWLGVGNVRFGFMIDGQIVYVHKFQHANSATSVYISSPNQPLRYEIRQSGVGSGSLQQICSTVMSEGGYQKFAVNVSHSNDNNYVSMPTARVQCGVLGVRLKPGYENTNLVPFSLQMSNSVNLKWMLALNPTLDGTVTFNSIPNTCLEGAICSSGNTLVSSGIVLQAGYAGASFYSAAGNDINVNFTESVKLGVGISGVKDTLFVIVSPLADMQIGASQFAGALNFKQLI